jgi:hypothetical protein
LTDTIVLALNMLSKQTTFYDFFRISFLTDSQEGESMTSKTKSYIFIAFFSTCVVLFLLLSNFPDCCEFFNSFDIFGHARNNFIFLMVAFVFSSYIMTELAVYACHFASRMRWQTPKIGKILVSQGYITQNQLFQALQEQSLRIGEVLVREERITPQQLLHALAIQKKKKGRLGEVLTELGYSKEEDIRWALYKTRRRLGKILRDKNLVSDYDLACALTLKSCRIDDHGRIFLRE